MPRGSQQKRVRFPSRPFFMSGRKRERINLKTSARASFIYPPGDNGIVSHHPKRRRHILKELNTCLAGPRKATKWGKSSQGKGEGHSNQEVCHSQASCQGSFTTRPQKAKPFCALRAFTCSRDLPSAERQDALYRKASSLTRAMKLRTHLQKDRVVGYATSSS